jgi:transposase
VVIEACGAAHHWARLLSGLGHDVKLLAPEVVRPFVKKGKQNDAADAAAICAAAFRPEMKFAPAKSLEQQATLTLHSARSLLVKQKTMLTNAMRGLATEFGLTVPQGVSTSSGSSWCLCRQMRAFQRRHCKSSEDCSTTAARCLEASRQLKRRLSLMRGTTKMHAVWRLSLALVRSPRP